MINLSMDFFEALLQFQKDMNHMPYMGSMVVYQQLSLIK